MDQFDQTTGSARFLFAISPDDVTKISRRIRGFFVGTGGNITLRSIDGTSDVVLKNVPAGSYHPIQATFIRITGTTAADIVGLV